MLLFLNVRCLKKLPSRSVDGFRGPASMQAPQLNDSESAARVYDANALHIAASEPAEGQASSAPTVTNNDGRNDTHDSDPTGESGVVCALCNADVQCGGEHDHIASGEHRAQLEYHYGGGEHTYVILNGTPVYLTSNVLYPAVMFGDGAMLFDIGHHMIVGPTTYSIADLCDDWSDAGSKCSEDSSEEAERPDRQSQPITKSENGSTEFSDGGVVVEDGRSYVVVRFATADELGQLKTKRQRSKVLAMSRQFSLGSVYRDGHCYSLRQIAQHHEGKKQKGTHIAHGTVNEVLGTTTEGSTAKRRRE